MNWRRDIVGQLAVLSLVLQTPIICAQSVSHIPMGSPRLLGYSSLGQETHQKSQARFTFFQKPKIWLVAIQAKLTKKPTERFLIIFSINQHLNLHMSTYLQVLSLNVSIILFHVGYVIFCRDFNFNQLCN